MNFQCLATVIALVLASIGNSTIAQTAPVQLQNYNFDVRYDPADSLVDVVAQVDLQRSDTVKQFLVILSSDARIDSINTIVSKKSLDFPHTFLGKDTLSISFPKEIGEKKELKMNFKYSVPAAKMGELVYVGRGHRWYPLIMDQIAKFRMQVSVPDSFEVLSAGDFEGVRSSGKQQIYTWSSRIPVFKNELIIVRRGHFSKSSLAFDNIDLDLYLVQKKPEIANRVLADIEKEMKFFGKMIGKYANERLTVVEVPEFDGINIASGLLLVGSSNFSDFDKGNREPLRLAVACQWYSTCVFPKFLSRGFWFLQLSLPHYLRLMYLQEAEGAEAFRKELDHGREQYKSIAESTADIALLDIDFPNTREKGIVIYAKGPSILDTVVSQLGDEKWKKFLSETYKQYKGKIFRYEDFKSSLSKYDSTGTLVARLDVMLSSKGE